MKIKNKIYKDLLETYELWNAWKPDFTFPLDEVDKEFLSKIQLEEVSFCSTIKGEDFFNYELVVNEFSKLINEYKSSYLLSFGYDALNKNRLRTYKGLTHSLKSKNIDSTNYEFDCDDGRSILGVKINLKLLDNLSLDEVLFKMPNNYIVLSESNDFNIPFLKLMKNTLTIKDNIVDLNFNCVLEQWFKNNDKDINKVVRIGGNGNTEISIQKFSLKDNEGNT